MESKADVVRQEFLFCPEINRLEVWYGAHCLTHLICKISIKILCTNLYETFSPLEGYQIVDCLFQTIFATFSMFLSVFEFKQSSESPNYCHTLILIFHEILWQYFVT